MSFRLSFHLALPDPTGPHWPDDAPDLSCQDSTRQHSVNDPLLSCKQQVGGSSPPPGPKGATQRLYSKASNHAAVAALATVELRGLAFGLLAAVQSFGNLAASAIAGLLWTLASLLAELLDRCGLTGRGRRAIVGASAS
jgi:hypothetical protein